MLKQQSLSERADMLEARMSAELDIVYTRSALTNMEDGQLGPVGMGAQELQKHPGKHFLIGDDPRLPKLPSKPTLLDYFECRMPGAYHLLQSANLASKMGLDEKTVLACLLHDISVVMFLKSDHGYWGAQLIEPYVDEEISWAIRYHQALRFFPDESVNYEYPKIYTKYFGEDYRPDEYIEVDYRYARNHKWYMTSRMITVNDVYSFDPNANVSLDQFVDIIGRHFRQPSEGLGFDNSPSAHMWRTIWRPTKYL